MKILLAGATGFVGRSLVPALLKDAHEVVVVGRNKEKIEKLWGDKVTGYTWQTLTISPDDFDAVINLAGENIADKRWSASVKKSLLDSRLNTTKKLIDWLSQATTKKAHLYNASAIGIYGSTLTPHQNTTPLTETSVAPEKDCQDFAAKLVQEWEKTANLALANDNPVTLMRFGVVLKRNEGALKKLGLQFNVCLGGTIGSGEQSFSWIHIDDLVSAILFLLKHPEITGPVNLTSPGCVSQKDFAQTLATAMHRPCLLPLPAFLIKTAFGQMGEELLLAGQHVFPERLLDNKFEFQHPDLQSALAKEWH